MKKNASAIIIATIISTAATFLAKYCAGLYNKMFFVVSPAGDLANKILVSILLGVALSIVGYLLYFKKLQAIYSIFIYILTFILTVVEIFCISHFHMFIGWRFIEIVVTTDGYLEAMSFFKSYVGFKDIVLVLCLIFCFVLIWKNKEILTNFFIKHKKTTVALLITPALFSYIMLGSITGITGIGNTIKRLLNRQSTNIAENRNITQFVYSIPIYGLYNGLVKYVRRLRFRQI